MDSPHVSRRGHACLDFIGDGFTKQNVNGSRVDQPAGRRADDIDFQGVVREMSEDAGGRCSCKPNFSFAPESSNLEATIG